MSRRLLTVVLHWSNAVLVLLLLASGGQNALLAWAFAAGGLLLVGLALAAGLLNGPGPKLQGVLRRFHPWGNRAMYLLLAWASIAVAAAQTGHPLPGPEAGRVLAIVFGVSLLHGCFHLWRSTALNDGALRRMLP